MNKQTKIYLGLAALGLAGLLFWKSKKTASTTASNDTRLFPEGVPIYPATFPKYNQAASPNTGPFLRMVDV